VIDSAEPDPQKDIATHRDAASYIYGHLLHRCMAAEASCVADGWHQSRLPDSFPFSSAEHAFYLGFQENEYFVNYGNVTIYEIWTEDYSDNSRYERALYVFSLLGFRRRVESLREVERRLQELCALQENRSRSDEADADYCEFREKLELLPGESYEEGYTLLVTYYFRHETAFATRLPPGVTFDKLAPYTGWQV